MADREDQLRDKILMEEEVHPEMFQDNFSEETAAEIAPELPRSTYSERVNDRNSEDSGDHQSSAGTGVGIVALTLSILSLLFMPITLGTAGVVVGIVAYMRGSKGLGLWAIGIGALSLISQFFFAPMLI